MVRPHGQVREAAGVEPVRTKGRGEIFADVRRLLWTALQARVGGIRIRAAQQKLRFTANAKQF